jgi:hypothetical protein
MGRRQQSCRVDALQARTLQPGADLQMPNSIEEQCSAHVFAGVENLTCSFSYGTHSPPATPRHQQWLLRLGVVSAMARYSAADLAALSRNTAGDGLCWIARHVTLRPTSLPQLWHNRPHEHAARQHSAQELLQAEAA